MLKFLVVQNGTQLTHCILPVLGLVARFGILNQDFLFLASVRIFELIAQPHAGLHLIYVLSARTAGTESIPRDARLFDVHLNRIVHQRSDENGCERSHTLALSIIGRYAHQTVDTVLAFQIAVGIIARYFNGTGLDSGLIAFLQVGNSCLISVCFGISQIHTHQHARPVLALRAAGSRIYFQYTIHLVGFLTKHILEFKGLYGSGCLCIGLIHFLFRYQFILVEIECKLQLIRHNLDFIVAGNPLLQAFHFLHLSFGGFLVIPEPRSLRAQLLLFHLYFFSFDVQIAVQRFGTFLDIFQLFNGNHMLSILSFRSAKIVQKSEKIA